MWWKRNDGSSGGRLIYGRRVAKLLDVALVLARSIHMFLG